MATYEVKITAGPHVDVKTFGTAKETIKSLKVHAKSESEAEAKAKADEKVEEKKEEKKKPEKAKKA